MQGEISSSYADKSFIEHIDRLVEETPPDETRIVLKVLDELVRSKEALSQIPERWREVVENIQKGSGGKRAYLCELASKHIARRVLPETKAKKTKIAEESPPPVSFSERLSFPEDKYSLYLQKANEGLLSAEECESLCREAASKGAVSQALELCEKAVEKYRVENRTDKIYTLRAFAATKLSSAIHPLLKDLRTSIFPREIWENGTYIPHVDAGAVKFGLLHGEKRKTVSAQGIERESCIFDFQLVHAEQERRNKWLNQYDEPERKQLDYFDAQLKIIKDKSETADYENPGYEALMEELSKKRKGILEDRARLVLNKALYNLNKDLLGTKQHLPEQYRNIKCRYEKVQYPFFRDGHYLDNKTFVLMGEEAPIEELVVEFEGIGKVRLGIDQRCVSSYGSVRVELDNPSSPNAAEQIHTMLASMGLGMCLTQSSPADIARAKVFHLFRSFYPRAAFEIETEKSSFEMPILSLIEKIIAKEPQMEGIFQKYLIEHPSLIQEEESVLGAAMLNIRDFGELVRQKGGIGLIAGISAKTLDAQVTSLCEICLTGPTSTKERFQKGLIIEGASPQEDFRSGGADSVFTRMVTVPMIEQRVAISASPLFEIQVLYDLDAVGLCGTFGYAQDHYGRRSKSSDPIYAQRQSLLELVATLPAEACTNEVMIRQRISPRYIKRIVVNTQEQKDQLIDQIRKKELLLEHSGIEYFYEKPIEKFIVVADELSPNLWKEEEKQ